MNEHAPLQIGVIGIGVMGLPIAAHLRDTGFAITVHDIRDEAMVAAAEDGLQTAASPASLAAAMDVLIVIVVDAAQIDVVLFGAGGVIHHAPRNDRQPLIVLLCSTIAPDDVARFARRLAEYGIETIDAPVSGGPVRARSGSISMMLAAPEQTLEHAAAITAAMADKRFVISTHIGDAARVKLVNNLLAGANLVAAAEAMALGTQLGLNTQTLFDVISQSSGASWIFSDRMVRTLHDDFVPRAALTLLTKDLTLACTMAQSIAQPTPVADAALAVFKQAVASDLGALDDAAVIKAYFK